MKPSAYVSAAAFRFVHHTVMWRAPRCYFSYLWPWLFGLCATLSMAVLSGPGRAVVFGSPAVRQSSWQSGSHAGAARKHAAIQPVQMVAGDTKPPHIPKKMRINLAWQIALAANNFSPGIIDGVFGPDSRMALREYAASFFPGHNPFDPHDPAIFNALGVDVQHVIAQYTISNRDAQAVGHLHYHWRAMAAASRMPYGSLEGCICEKFHTTRRLLSHLNPDVNLKKLVVGQTLFVPNIRPFPNHNDFGLPGGLSAVLQQDKREMPMPTVAYLTINLAQKAIRAYNRHNREVALFHCSIPAHHRDYPVTDAVIKDIALNPDYTFLPSVFHSVHNIHHPLLIPPGPRNPVGVVWMGLSIPNVGMHGNPEPELIGLTGSHGCFRMTNWDAAHLLTLVHIGLPVIMINPDNPIALTLNLPRGLNPPGVTPSAKDTSSGYPAGRRIGDVRKDSSVRRSGNE